MINSNVCLGKSNIGKCHLFSLNMDLKENIRVARISNRNISILQYNLNKCISENSIEKVINFRSKYIDRNYLSSIKEFEFNDYRLLNVESKGCVEQAICGSICKQGEVDIRSIVEETELKVKRYNADLNVVRKVQNYCKALDFKVHYDKSVYLRFGRDKNSDLIALYFNIDSFIMSDKYSPVEVAFVFSGEGEYPFKQHTMLHLKRDGSEPYVNIWGFQSNNPNKGHGTFILRNLEDLVMKINKKISYFWDESIYMNHNRGPIEVITGEVTAGKIPYNKLVAYYNKNGLPTITKIRDGSTVNILVYKTLDC